VQLISTELSATSTVDQTTSSIATTTDRECAVQVANAMKVP